MEGHRRDWTLALGDSLERPGKGARPATQFQDRFARQQVQHVPRRAGAHQIRISFNLSWCVQYLSETRSRSAIDRIAEDMTAFRPTGGGASKFPWTIKETSSLTGTRRGVRQPSPTFDFLRARMY